LLFKYERSPREIVVTPKLTSKVLKSVLATVRPTQLDKEETMPVQRWNPETYAKHARFVSDLGMEVFELLSPAKSKVRQTESNEETTSRVSLWTLRVL
jgi:hypothetical protein